MLPPVVCCMCDEELKDLGGLLFGPPVEGYVKKDHLCENCYDRLQGFILGESYREWQKEHPDGETQS